MNIFPMNKWYRFIYTNYDLDDGTDMMIFTIYYHGLLNFMGM
jgi:hypothetical protein